MKGQILEFIKKFRLKRIQSIQENIANNKNKEMIGKEVEVLIDSFNKETGFYEGRTNKMSPNVDFYINVEDDPQIIVGEFYKVIINSYENYAFTGKLKN